MRTSKTIIYIFFIFVFLFMGGVLAPGSKGKLNLSKQLTELNFKNDFVKIFNFGQPLMIGDLIWLNTFIESDLEHYNKNDLNSWMFHRFNLVSDLDPYFYESYIYGGQYLSIVKDDEFGAESIYTKGIHFFPDDYSLNFNLAFHYYFELGDIEKSLIYFRKVIGHPKAPFYLQSLVARIEAEKGNLNSSLILLNELYKKNRDNKMLRERYFTLMYSIKAEQDLKCLNENGSNCEMKDLEGREYIEQNGVFKAQKEWKKFRPFKKN